MSKLILPVGLLLSACTTPPVTQRVEVPIAVSCIKKQQLPERPKYESYHLAPDATDGDKVLAVTRDWLRSRPYEATLEAISTGCANE